MSSPTMSRMFGRESAAAAVDNCTPRTKNDKNAIRVACLIIIVPQKERL
jgi:hypothetical protein